MKSIAYRTNPQQIEVSGVWVRKEETMRKST